MAACQSTPKPPIQSAEHLEDTATSSLSASNEEYATSNKTGTPEATNPVIPQPPGNLWDRVIAGFGIEDVDNERIQAQLKWFKRHPSHMKRICERATPLLFDIVEVMEQNNIPSELALLPVIESAYRPYSYSHGRAAGLWQFIPSTGKMMGLQQNWWYDGRRDIHASTRAAANYLNSLNTMLKGDWLHTLAGYNAGPGHVIKAVRRNQRNNKPTSYWDLRLPKETMAYVPKLIAVKKVIQNPAAYGIELCDIPNKPALQLVEFEKQLDLSIAADLSQLSIDELYALNPGFNQWATPPKGPHHLLLPIKKAKPFQLAEAGLPDNQRVRWQRHTIKPGDTLSDIALQYRTTIGEIKQTNKLRNNTLRTGKHLLIPTSSKSGSAYTYSQSQREKRQLNKSGKGNKLIYTVRSGDSWWDIAQRHNTHHRKLARWNNKSPLDPLRPGQKLVIWTNKPNLNAASISNKNATQKLHYPVRRGDSLYTIAKKFNVSVKEIVNWNQLRKNKYLQPGQKLVIYVDVRRQWSGT